ncbi:MAG TPA: T9SS type A sorting domain-containing protein [Flavobacteriales bacterium]|nr:T9SS type A sorting domain-containing protein [Flavobacteriales bacterium]HIN40279.1 T9SS type A sorting domain-containing protein [Flavobacteriales bacterium]
MVVTNAFGCRDSITKHNFIFVGIDTGISVTINEEFYINSFFLYPNPTTDHINLLLSLSEREDVTVRVLSLQGQEISSRTIESVNPGTTEIRMDLRTKSFNKGMYIIDMKYKNKHYYKKFVINSQHYNQPY